MLGDDAVDGAGVSRVDRAQHLPCPLVSLRRHARIVRHRSTCCGRPEPSQRGQAIRCKFVERDDGGERPVLHRTSKSDVEAGSPHIQPKQRGFPLRDSVNPKIVNAEMQSVGRSRAGLEDDRRWIGLRGPEDLLGESCDAWVGCENTTPIARRPTTLFHRLIARRTIVPGRQSCNLGCVAEIPRRARSS